MSHSVDSLLQEDGQHATKLDLDSSDATGSRKKSHSHPDAGLRSLDHYKNRLPRWRYDLRQSMIPLVRWETPYLAWLQQKFRCPALDTYFAITANLGTHTFFLIFLPVLFWCGHTDLGRSLTNVLAAGVFFSGFVKDMVCLPRPLSPPLQRLTMSDSAALEYGFPSTHATNAVSVALYLVLRANAPSTGTLPVAKLITEVASYVYAISILLGRLYCGMHGFLDVSLGALIGIILSLFQWTYGEAIDQYLYSDHQLFPLLAMVSVVIVLVRIHPEPADDCPCFDDSAAFAGCWIGCEIGNWHYARSGWAWDFPVPATVPFNIDEIGWAKAVARIVIGVMTVFAWREIMKPALHKVLPPVFRIVESFGLDLPRRFFKQASQYNEVPYRLKDDNVFPSITDLPGLIKALRHPRHRSVSVGPQSAADVHETIAYRDKKRRDSLSSQRGKDRLRYRKFQPTRSNDKEAATSSSHREISPGLKDALPSQMTIESYEAMMGEGKVLLTLNDQSLNVPSSPDKSTPPDNSGHNSEIERQKDEDQMFLNVLKPRVRYDVEVVTKLVVYTGIGWLAVEGGPLLFDMLGLGMS